MEIYPPKYHFPLKVENSMTKKSCWFWHGWKLHFKWQNPSTVEIYLLKCRFSPGIQKNRRYRIKIYWIWEKFQRFYNKNIQTYQPLNVGCCEAAPIIWLASFNQTESITADEVFQSPYIEYQDWISWLLESAKTLRLLFFYDIIFSSIFWFLSYSVFEYYCNWNMENSFFELV